MTTNPTESKKIEHPCLNCGREERSEITGILGRRCQAKVRKTWGAKPDRQNVAAVREDRLSRIHREHVVGKRGPVRRGINGGSY